MQFYGSNIEYTPIGVNSIVLDKYISMPEYLFLRDGELG